MEAASPRNLFAKAWRGNERLWVVWWVYGAAVAALLAVVAWFVLGHPTTSAQAIFLLAVLLTMFTIVIAWTVMVWRCAPNAGNQIWKLIARASAVILPAGLFVMVFVPWR